jgi:hypothetical protein
LRGGRGFLGGDRFGFLAEPRAFRGGAALVGASDESDSAGGAIGRGDAIGLTVGVGDTTGLTTGCRGVTATGSTGETGTVTRSVGGTIGNPRWISTIATAGWLRLPVASTTTSWNRCRPSGSPASTVTVGAAVSIV